MIGHALTDCIARMNDLGLGDSLAESFRRGVLNSFLELSLGRISRLSRAEFPRGGAGGVSIRFCGSPCQEREW